MTKQEIQALIDAKIAGQGSAVDVGGALPKILTEILNAAFAGANVQSDWDENDNADPSFIKNKPTIPAAQVQSDWAQDDEGEVDFIKNKPSMDFVQMIDITNDLGNPLPSARVQELRKSLVVYDTYHSPMLRINNFSVTLIASILEMLSAPEDSTIEAIWGSMKTDGDTIETISAFVLYFDGSSEATIDSVEL